MSYIADVSKFALGAVWDHCGVRVCVFRYWLRCQKKGAWTIKGKQICEELCFNKLHVHFYFNKLTNILFKKMPLRGTRLAGYLRKRKNKTIHDCISIKHKPEQDTWIEHLLKLKLKMESAKYQRAGIQSRLLVHVTTTRMACDIVSIDNAGSPCENCREMRCHSNCKAHNKGDTMGRWS